MTAVSVRLKFQLGARTLATIPRRLVRVALSLDDVLAGDVPILPALPTPADGYVVTSLPADRVDALVLESAHALRRGEGHRARTALRRALELAEPEARRRPFRDAP